MAKKVEVQGLHGPLMVEPFGPVWSVAKLHPGQSWWDVGRTVPVDRLPAAWHGRVPAHAGRLWCKTGAAGYRTRREAVAFMAALQERYPEVYAEEGWSPEARAQAMAAVRTLWEEGF